MKKRGKGGAPRGNLFGDTVGRRRGGGRIQESSLARWEGRGEKAGRAAVT